MIGGVILAGGASRRMGGQDKALLPLAGKPMILHAIAAITGQVSHIAINRNDPLGGDIAIGGADIITDTLPDRQGPLAGILAGLNWADEMGFDAIISVPCDCPFLPNDLVFQLSQEASPFALAESAERLHPVIGYWPVKLRTKLESWLKTQDERKIERFLSTLLADDQPLPIASWPVDGYDPFMNVNTKEDLLIAQQIYQQLHGAN